MAIEGSWLPLILPENCRFSVPLELPPPSFDDATGTIKCHMTCNYGIGGLHGVLQTWSDI